MMDSLSQFSRALVLCPHTDDEFGCAGTIWRLVKAGVEVHYLALSRCEESVPDGLPSDILERECRACTKSLGLSSEHVTVDRFPVRHFPRDRQLILEKFVQLNRTFTPDLVMMPSMTDIHQDHQVVGNEGIRAFKHATLLGYELPQNTIAFPNAAYVHLTEEAVNAKIEALSCYASQDFRPYATEKFIRALATIRGVQAGAPYAEAFEVIRLMVR